MPHNPITYWVDSLTSEHSSTLLVSSVSLFNSDVEAFTSSAISVKEDSSITFCSNPISTPNGFFGLSLDPFASEAASGSSSITISSASGALGRNSSLG